MNQLVPIQEEPELARPATSLVDDADSLLSFLPPRVSEMVGKALGERPELFDKGESELWRHLKRETAVPNPTDNCLRLKFWMEYDRARTQGEKKLCIDNVIAGICYKEYFYKTYLTNPFKLAWMLCMPTGYHTRTVEALEFGVSRMRAILEMDPVMGGFIDPETGERQGGKVNNQLVAIQMKIVEMMNTWVKGAPVQRSIAVNVHKKAEAMSTELSMEELERKFAALEKRNALARNIPIDVGPSGSVTDDIEIPSP